MPEQYYLRVVDLETQESTISEPSHSEREATEYAERLVEEFFGDDDVTWFEHLGLGRYHVGRIFEDGSRSEPLVRVTVEEEEVEDDSESL